MREGALDETKQASTKHLRRDNFHKHLPRSDYRRSPSALYLPKDKSQTHTYTHTQTQALFFPLASPPLSSPLLPSPCLAWPVSTSQRSLRRHPNNSTGSLIKAQAPTLKGRWWWGGCWVNFGEVTSSFPSCASSHPSFRPVLGSCQRRV